MQKKAQPKAVAWSKDHAYHEAGHVVVGIAKGRELKLATVIDRPRVEWISGYTKNDVSNGVVAVAGHVAEQSRKREKFSGRTICGRGGQDAINATLAANNINEKLNLAKQCLTTTEKYFLIDVFCAEADRLLMANSDLLKLIANALIKKGELTKGDVDKFLIKFPIEK